MGMGFNHSNLGRLLVLIISLVHAVDRAKFVGGGSEKKAGTFIEYELSKVPSKHDEFRPEDAMDVFMQTILSDKHGAMIYQLPTGAKLGQIKEAPQDRLDHEQQYIRDKNTDKAEAETAKVEEANTKVLGPAEAKPEHDINEIKTPGEPPETTNRKDNKITKFGNSQDSGYTSDEPVQHIPEIDVSDKKMEADRAAASGKDGFIHGVNQDEVVDAPGHS